jgi:hypothetical protein
MIDHTLQERAKDVLSWLAVPNNVLLQPVRRQRIQPRISGLGDGVPGRPHLVERRRAGGCAIGKQLVNLRQWQLTLRVEQKISLLCLCQVPDVPTDAVHRQELFAGVSILQALECAPEFVTRKAQLEYQWVRHSLVPFSETLRRLTKCLDLSA